MNILKIDRGMSKLFWRCERGGGGWWYAKHLEFRRWVQPNSYADRFTANKKLELNMRQSLIEKYSISIMDRNGKDAKKECHHNWPIFFLLFKKKSSLFHSIDQEYRIKNDARREWNMWRGEHVLWIDLLVFYSIQIEASYKEFDDIEWCFLGNLHRKSKQYDFSFRRQLSDLVNIYSE